MNLNCVICSDLLSPSAEIFSTACGHVFHYTCLLQWLQQSRTCPQCRCRSTEKSIHRLYFNIVSNDSETEDPTVLQCKLDSAQFQLKLKEKDLQNTHEKCDKALAQTLGLKEVIKSLESQDRQHTTVIETLKSKITHLKEKKNVRKDDMKKLEEEVAKLRKKNSDLQNTHLVLHGSRTEVDSMLKRNKDPESLIVLVSSLKQELMDNVRRKKQTSKMLKEAQQEAASYRHQLSSLQKENLKMRQNLDNHRNCDSEKQFLKVKLASIKNTTDVSTSNNTLERIIHESPAPFTKIQCQTSNLNSLNSQESEENFDSSGVEIISPGIGVYSPSVLERVQSIKDSESPIIKSNFSTLLSNRKANHGANKFSIFKQPIAKVKNPIVSKSSNVIYDGLGGHGKDEHFPSPSQAAGVKRKATGKTSSAKFKRLAPNKKLDDFFSGTS